MLQTFKSSGAQPFIAFNNTWISRLPQLIYAKKKKVKQDKVHVVKLAKGLVPINAPMNMLLLKYSGQSGQAYCYLHEAESDCTIVQTKSCQKSMAHYFSTFSMCAVLMQPILIPDCCHRMFQMNKIIILHKSRRKNILGQIQEKTAFASHGKQTPASAFIPPSPPLC